MSDNESSAPPPEMAKPIAVHGRTHGFMSRFWRIAKLGLWSLRLHPLRSLLTILGIIIGVGAVIFMLAVVEGRAEEIQARIRARGSTNVLIRAKKPAEEQSAGATRNRMIIYGLTYADAAAIRATYPEAEVIVPVREVDGAMYYREFKTDSVAFGTVPWYPEVSRAEMARGRWFTDVEMRRAKPVAVIGPTLAERLFRFHDPVGKYIRIGSKPFRVIGVIKPTVTSDAEEALKRDRAAYIPVTTVRERFGDRNVKRSSGSMEIEQVELHQILVRLRSMADVLPVATAVAELMDRRHDEDDFEIDVPLALLREAREAAARDKRLFGAIAGISLLVGGIGIMNIMLASVTERTREIGVRRALGAMRRDITFQFLVETLILSLLGGVIGIVLGIVACELYTWLGKGETIITPISIFLSFGISGAVGILAGLYPAIRGARMDPITALRHE